METFAKVILCVFVSGLVHAGVSRSNSRIQGNIAEDGQYPYVAGMKIGNYVYCTATILDEYHLLATRSCLSRIPFEEVLVGTNNWEDPTSGVVYPIAEWTSFPNSSSNLIFHDVAVVRLNEPMQFNEKVQPVKLAKNPTSAPRARIIGWSSVFGNHFSYNITDLLYTDVNIISNEDCDSAYQGRYTIPDFAFCIVNDEGVGLCTEDAGNPLVVDGEQIGIASYVKGTYCYVDRPDIFIDVTKYLDWINDVITGNA